MTEYHWIVDLDRCIGCETCVIACKQENGTIPGVQYRRVHRINPEQFPGYPTFRISIACNHCEKPACLPGCPVKAYTLRDGVVVHNPEVCIGCGYCVWVCPYDAPQYNPAKGKVEKCGLCAGRRAQGLEPACVAACPTGALRWSPEPPEASPITTAKERPASNQILTTLPGFPEDQTQPKLRLINRRRPIERRRDSR